MNVVELVSFVGLFDWWLVISFGLFWWYIFDDWLKMVGGSSGVGVGDFNCWFDSFVFRL